MQITEFKKSDTFQGDYFTHIKSFEYTLLHKHDFIEFFFVSSGNCNHIFNGKTTTLSTGDAFLLVPGDIHTFIYTENETTFTHRDIVFSFSFFKEVCDSLSPTFYDVILTKNYPLSLRITSEQIMQIESYIIPITLETDPAVQKMLQKSLASYILNMIVQNSFKHSATPSWLIKLLSFLSEPACFTIPLSDLVGRFNYAPSYMCRKFKEYTGKTMSQYFNEQKILYAHSLLQGTPFSIAQICEIVGINSATYFHRLFKKYYGFSPRQ